MSLTGSVTSNVDPSNADPTIRISGTAKNDAVPTVPDAIILLNFKCSNLSFSRI